MFIFQLQIISKQHPIRVQVLFNKIVFDKIQSRKEHNKTPSSKSIISVDRSLIKSPERFKNTTVAKENRFLKEINDFSYELIK
jgi:hypothetical protein